MEELYYTMALRSVKGIGNRLAERLLSLFDSPKDIFSLSEKDIMNIEGINHLAARGIFEFSDWEEIEETISKAEKKGFNIVTIRDSEYPSNLLAVYDKPTVLYIFGEINSEDKDSVAMVGARFCNDYGKKVAGKISSELAERGVTVVSGMARGIDSISHKAAIDAGGRTIAVLGSGLDRIYPPENARLYKQISENGAVLSEFPLGAAPDAQNFPQRNRLISGISKGVIIVQASRKSGSLITSGFALEQNREVFAVPGNIGSRLSEGTNDLIKKGAKLIENADDVLEELNIAALNAPVGTEFRSEFYESFSEDEKAVLEVLHSNDLNLDEIIDITKLDYTNLCSILLDLELKGILNQLPGKKYQLAR